MQVRTISRTLLLLTEAILLKNELGGNFGLAHKFSDPDGVRSGKSGYSFGITQFDILNNPLAILALRDMEFTTDEILGLKRQDIDIRPLNRKLHNQRVILAEWDRKQINDCLYTPRTRLLETGVKLESEVVFLHIADYHNQFYFSKGGKLYRYLVQQAQRNRVITCQDFLAYKLTLKWAMKHRRDILRRYRNIQHIIACDCPVLQEQEPLAA